MKDRKSSTRKFTKSLEITYPEREMGHAITHADWRRLKKKVSQIRTTGSLLIGFGFLCIGVGATALFAALNLSEMGTVKNTSCWVVSITGLVAGVLLIVFYLVYQRNQESHSKQEAVDCLGEIEENFTEPSDIPSEN